MSIVSVARAAWSNQVVTTQQVVDLGEASNDAEGRCCVSPGFISMTCPEVLGAEREKDTEGISRSFQVLASGRAAVHRLGTQRSSYI